MNSSGIQFTQASVRLISVAALAASLAIAPGLTWAADPVAHADRAERRIQQIHSKLMVTAAQEAQWSKVAAVMAENARIMDTLTRTRAAHAKEMSAVDDLKSYGEIADAHAEGIRTLMPAFATLYASMSDGQKKEADILFRHGERRPGPGKTVGK